VVAPGVTKVEDRIIVAHIWPPRGHRIRPSQFRAILTGINARQASCLYQSAPPRAWHDVSPQQRDRSEFLIRQETVMSKLIHAAATTVAILSSVGFAAAQNASNHPDLTPIQQRTLSQGLANSPSQSAPAAQPQVGDKMPDSMTAQSLPSNVTDQVPEAKNLLFVKLPDRVLLIDPDNKVVTELVMDSGASSDTTTGSSSGSSDRPSR
jgi:hypothetical protein